MRSKEYVKMLKCKLNQQKVLAHRKKVEGKSTKSTTKKDKVQNQLKRLMASSAHTYCLKQKPSLEVLLSAASAKLKFTAYFEFTT